MFEGVPFPVICLVVFLHQGIRGEDVRTVTGYIGESVDLQANADPSWNLRAIRWSIYENITFIAISQSNQKNVDRFYLFIGRLELNTTSGDLTINRLLLSDALKYRVELTGKVPNQRRTSYFELSVQERLIKPSIHLRYNILYSGYCAISLSCVSKNSKISLSWQPEHSFPELSWSGQQGRAGESVMWTTFTPNQVVTFSCIADDGSHKEISHKNVTCKATEPGGDNTLPRPTVVIHETSKTGIYLGVIIGFPLGLMIFFFYYKCKANK